MDWPFRSDVVRNKWSLIRADGFDADVPGCVYDGEKLDGGIPLGGLGTGYFTLEGSGLIGRCTLFNDIVPPRKDFTQWLVFECGGMSVPLSTGEIAYWGHYPIADMAVTFSRIPLSAGIRAFCPFIPGDSRDSNIPAALFEIRLRNTGTGTLDLKVHFIPPGKPGTPGVTAEVLGDCVHVENSPEPRAVMPLTLEGGQARTLRFVYGWHAPDWRDSGNEAHVHQYATRYQNAREAAADAWDRFDSLLRRILRWQSVIYRENLPGWLRDALVQSFYSLAKNTVWIAKTRKDEWWSGENGWFTHNESHTGCPITETMVCRMHGHFPALFFFPELEETTLDAFRHFQIGDGEIPFSYGQGTSMRDPRYHCQHPLNSGQYAQMVYRLFLRTGEERILRKFYDSAKRAVRYQYTLDDDGDGLVNDQAHVRPGEFWPANQFYDIWPWWGTSAYVAGTWLATLVVAAAMADRMGDREFARECRGTLEKGLLSFEEKLWTGGYYRVWNDPENGRGSDVSLGNQLMGEWCLRVAGEQGALPADHVRKALETVAALNMRATRHGLVNGVTPDGSRYDAGYAGAGDHARHIFFGENLCAAMTFMYGGDLQTGMEIAKRLYEAVALTSRSPWNQRCLIHSETGLPVWGDDYYSNMVIWAVPMALGGSGIGSFVQPGGLADRILRTADEE